MSPPKDPVLDAVINERQLLERRIKVLDGIERQLRAAGPAPRPTPGVGTNRAPSGELRRAMLAALKGAGPVMSAALKKRIRSGGYEHHINGQYFTKTLRGLVKEKVVLKEPNGAYSTYALR
jgi:hypothetical protein